MTIETTPPTPDIFSAKRILCIQPHSDDNDIGAGGTIARLAKNGVEAIYLTVTDDLAGVVDISLSAPAATAVLARDQLTAGKIIGVQEQIVLNYPDAGEYDCFALCRDLLKYIRKLKPDFVFTCNPWLTYEAHRDHIQTGLAVAEAIIFSTLLNISSSDPAVDAARKDHSIQGVGLYYSHEPNLIVNVASTWETKVAAIRCYETQIPSDDADQIVMVLQLKSKQIYMDGDFKLGEPFKVLHPRALHCGI